MGEVLNNQVCLCLSFGNSTVSDMKSPSSRFARVKFLRMKGLERFVSAAAMSATRSRAATNVVAALLSAMEKRMEE